MKAAVPAAGRAEVRGRLQAPATPHLAARSSRVYVVCPVAELAARLAHPGAAVEALVHRFAPRALPSAPLRAWRGKEAAAGDPLLACAACAFCELRVEKLVAALGVQPAVLALAALVAAAKPSITSSSIDK